MNMKILKLIPALVLFAGLTFTSCKPKDGDIKTAVETALKANPDFAAASVAVADGVATLTGEVKDEATKAAIETAAKAAKGVKNVVNNLTVTPPPTAPVVIAADDPLAKGIADATKDFPSVKAAVDNGVVTLTGKLDAAKLPMLMKAISALKPKQIVNNLNK